MLDEGDPNEKKKDRVMISECAACLKSEAVFVGRIGARTLPRLSASNKTKRSGGKGAT